MQDADADPWKIATNHALQPIKIQYYNWVWEKTGWSSRLDGT